MANKIKELRYLLCDDHADQAYRNLYRYHPSFIFNIQPIDPPKECSYNYCSNLAYFEAVGLEAPTTIPSDLEASDKVVLEIFNSAKELLTGGVSGIKVPEFLKSKLLPLSNNLVIDNLINKFSNLLLQKLKIDSHTSLTDQDINKVLLELKLFPVDYDNLKD